MATRRKHNWSRLVAGLFIILITVIPTPARSDGGIITEDPHVWEQIQEGDQIAIVHLSEEDVASIDLFVSLRDFGDTSSKIRYFVPLGIQPTRFDVVEEESANFASAQIFGLDRQLQDAAQNKIKVRDSLLWSGTPLVPGTGILKLLLLLLDSIGDIFGTTMDALGGDMLPDIPPEISPEMTLWTAHTRIDVYALNEDVNLEALIATTGLSPSVQDTLRRYEGQQIAVITLQTQPGNELGLHLSWASPLLGDHRMTYAYPLGTGSAWAQPIAMTRIYVVSAPGVDFRITYPRLGRNRSGYTKHTNLTGYYPDYFTLVIAQHTDTPGYAVAQAMQTGPSAAYSRVWRAIYTHSNADKDIVIQRIEGLRPETRLSLFIREVAEPYTGIIGIVAAVIIWIIAWRFVMPRRLGVTFRWTHAVLWMCIYNVGSVLALLVLGALLALTMFVTVPILWAIGDIDIFIIPLGIASLYLATGVLNSYISSDAWKTPWKETVKAYALLTVTSAVAYGIFALVYLALAG